VTATDAATDSSFWPLSSGGPGIRILWQRQQEANKQRSNANTRQMGSRHPGIPASRDPAIRGLFGVRGNSRTVRVFILS